MSSCNAFKFICKLNAFKHTYILTLERDEGRERETFIYCSTRFYLQWLSHVCALIWDGTCNLGVWTTELPGHSQ